MKKAILSIFILLTFLLNTEAQDYSGYTKCAEQDSLALVAFYNATDGPNWISNQDGFTIAQLGDDVLTYYTKDHPNAGMGKWLVGPVKDWFGVLLEKQQVGNTHDSVWRVVHVRTTINRRDSGEDKLKGYIPKEVGLLTALKWFKVNGNRGLKGTEVPKELFHPTLTDLDLEYVYFQGELSAMRNCTKLAFINLRHNLFDSIPVFDFLQPDYLLNTFNWGGNFFLYDNKITLKSIEATVEYFLTFSNNQQVKFEARDQHDVGTEKEIIAQPGQNVVLSSNDGGKNGTNTWYRKGFSTYITGSTYTIKNIAAKDTGDYKVLLTNDYVRLYDNNSDYANIFTAPMHIRFTPSAPLLKSSETSYNGKEITLTFSKQMSTPSKTQVNEFIVTCGGIPVQISEIVLGGRFSEKLILKLATPAIHGEEVTVSYTKGSVVCSNNGVLESFPNMVVLNKTRVSPSVVKAVTRDDGTGIFVTFDQYIDPETLVASDFLVSSATATKVSSVIIKKGEIDEDISKTIELILTGGLASTDNIKISYNRGSLAGLYGALTASFKDVTVQNVIVENRTAVIIQVEDGTGELTSLVVKGNLRNLPFNLYDDGTNGDKIAGDHIWSYSLDLGEGDFKWEVYQREYTFDYDTVSTVSTDGTITQVITPIAVINDIYLSEGYNLGFSITNKTATGTTFFGYKNNTLTFILHMAGYMGSSEIAPFLMGIDDDWTTGIEMTLLSNNDWTTSVGGLSLSESVSFSFRNGNDWENSTPEVRKHTVVGSEILYCNFGNMVSSQITGIIQKLNVFPNPTNGFLNIRLPENFVTSELSVLDISGRKVINQRMIGTTINVGNLTNGYYFLRVKSVEGKTLQIHFLKK
jgi:uncharacterized repeat protein (TIGR02059 family)